MNSIFLSIAIAIAANLDNLGVGNSSIWRRSMDFLSAYYYSPKKQSTDLRFTTIWAKILYRSHRNIKLSRTG